MNVVYSSSDAYLKHAGVSITSLFEKNQHEKELNVFLIEYGVKQENRDKLNAVALKYKREIQYISFSGFEDRIRTDNSYNIPKNAYASLLLTDILPETCKKVIWLDCDTVVTDSLTELWNMDLEGKAIAAVQDCGGGYFWSEIGVNDYYRYFCAGVFVADLDKWRGIHAIEQFMQFIEAKNGHLEHADQTVLNGVLYNDCKILHPRYDVLTPTYVMPYHNLISYFKLQKGYYSKSEIKESIKRPAVIHFTSSNTGRPWEKGSKHPKAKIYRNYWKASPWKDIPGGVFVPGMDRQFRRTYWLYQHVPVSLINLAVKVKRR